MCDAFVQCVLQQKQDKEDDNQHIYGVQIELSIQEYVVESREEIYENRRAMRSDYLRFEEAD